MGNSHTAYLTLDDRAIAYQQIAGRLDKPGIVFLGGWGSSLTGTKATFLANECAAANLRYLRFDWRGHGISTGVFNDFTLGDWIDDGLKVLQHLTKGPQILVGSSMGGWISLCLARDYPEHVAGIVGIAAAPDFTETFVTPLLSEDQKCELETLGITSIPNSSNTESLPVSKKFLDEAKQHLVMARPLDLKCPVHLLQGQQDTEVPWNHALTIANKITNPNVCVTFIKDGTHRLGRPQDLDLLWRIIKSMIKGM